MMIFLAVVVVFVLGVLVWFAWLFDRVGRRIEALEKRMDRVDPWDSGALPGVGDRVVMNEGGPFPTVTGGLTTEAQRAQSGGKKS